MRDPIVNEHFFRIVVLDAFKAAQNEGANSPEAMACATKALMEAHPEISSG